MSWLFLFLSLSLLFLRVIDDYTLWSFWVHHTPWSVTRHLDQKRQNKKERKGNHWHTYVFVFSLFLRITYQAAIVLVIKKKKLEVVRAIVKLIFIIACLRTFGQLVIWAKIWWSFFSFFRSLSPSPTLFLSLNIVLSSHGRQSIKHF